MSTENDTANLGWSKGLFHIMINIKNSFQTIAVADLVLVFTNGNKTSIID